MRTTATTDGMAKEGFCLAGEELVEVLSVVVLGLDSEAEDSFAFSTDSLQSSVLQAQVL